MDTRSSMCYVGWVVWVHGGSAVSVRQVHTLQSSLFINTTGMTSPVTCLYFCDPKRSRHVNTLALLILHKLVYILILFKENECMLYNVEYISEYIPHEACEVCRVGWGGLAY